MNTTRLVVILCSCLLFSFAFRNFFCFCLFIYYFVLISKCLSFDNKAKLVFFFDKVNHFKIQVINEIVNIY